MPTILAATRGDFGVGTRKGKYSSFKNFPETLLSAMESLTCGVVIIMRRGGVERLEFANQAVGELLGIETADLVGEDSSLFWEQLFERIDNPDPVREDLARIVANPVEVRTDVLHLRAPTLRVVERSTAPLRGEKGRILGRVWTFSNSSREFRMREELQRRRKIDLCHRSLVKFLMHAPVSHETVEELCRLLCSGLDLASVGWFPLSAEESPLLAQFCVSERFLYESWEGALTTLVRKWCKQGGVGAPEFLPLKEMEEEERAPFSYRGITRAMLVPVFRDEVLHAVLLFEEERSDRDWLRDDLRSLESAAWTVGLWLKKAEAEKSAEVSRQEAEAAAKVRSDFIALLSHELRTPLNPLVGFTQLLQEQLETSDEETREMVSRISEGAMRLRELVEDLLTLTRLDQRLDGWRRYPCDPRSVVEDACTWARRFAGEKELTIDLKFGGDLGMVEADGAALRRALNAMLSNAMRFSPRKGTVRVHATGTPHELVIAVSDAGPGVAPEVKRKIFEPFVQGEPVLTRRHGGAGIGLTLVRKVADSHNGKVWVEDCPGGGSTFLLQIPRRGQYTTAE